MILSLMLSSGKDVGPDRINVSSLSRSVGKSSIGPRYSLKQAESLSLDARLCMRFVYRLFETPLSELGMLGLVLRPVYRDNFFSGSEKRYIEKDNWM